MNWGKGIVAGMIIFVIFIVGMCIYMFMSPADDFDHQYYEKGLTFNRDYDREEQVTKDHAQPLIALANREAVFTFIQPSKGKVRFMRPSNATADRSYTFDSGNNKTVSVPLGPFAAGKWQLVFEWTSDHKSYLYQQEIYIK
jgi:hypothetical protein